MLVRQTHHPRERRAVLLCLLCAAAAVAGCGGSEGPELARVTGRVLHQGQPVEGAQVRFAAAGSPRIAYAKTDADGRFLLTTFQTGDGAVVGEHRVAIFKHAPTQPAAAAKPTAVPGMNGASMESGPETNQLPARYQNPQDSPLRAAVTARGPNDFTFELKKR